MRPLHGSAFQSARYWRRARSRRVSGREKLGHMTHRKKPAGRRQEHCWTARPGRNKCPAPRRPVRAPSAARPRPRPRRARRRVGGRAAAAAPEAAGVQPAESAGGDAARSLRQPAPRRQRRPTPLPPAPLRRPVRPFRPSPRPRLRPASPTSPLRRRRGGSARAAGRDGGVRDRHAGAPLVDPRRRRRRRSPRPSARRLRLRDRARRLRPPHRRAARAGDARRTRRRHRNRARLRMPHAGPPQGSEDQRPRRRLAVDFMAIALADKRRVLVERQAGADVSAYFRALRTAACGWFTTVLGPGWTPPTPPTCTSTSSSAARQASIASASRQASSKAGHEHEHGEESGEPCEDVRRQQRIGGDAVVPAEERGEKTRGDRHRQKGAERSARSPLRARRHRARSCAGRRPAFRPSRGRAAHERRSARVGARRNQSTRSMRRAPPPPSRDTQPGPPAWGSSRPMEPAAAFSRARHVSLYRPPRCERNSQGLKPPLRGAPAFVLAFSHSPNGWRS